jgi:uncharacterized protein (DUF486 family)
MNIWVAKPDDVRLLHANDMYMIVLMTSWMIFLSCVHIYYSSFSSSNLGHNVHQMADFDTLSAMIVSAVFIVGSYYFVRNQTFVDDREFLRGMIPHHSMAILMAEQIKNRTKNEDLKKLANAIIKKQNEEIYLMKNIEHYI